MSDQGAVLMDLVMLRLFMEFFGWDYSTGMTIETAK